MSKDAGDIAEERPKPKLQSNSVRFNAPTDNTSWQWWRLPAPVKRIFDEFPLRTYPANELPQRTTTSRSRHTLYVFATEESARSGEPSFNPGCLKWQVCTKPRSPLEAESNVLTHFALKTYLKFQNIDFQCMPSSNHASPTGALPFLLPAPSSSEFPVPILSGRIQQWIRDKKSVKVPKNTRYSSSSAENASQKDDNVRKTRGKGQEGADMRYDAYMTLIDHRIRNAYVCLPRFSKPETY